MSPPQRQEAGDPASGQLLRKQTSHDPSGGGGAGAASEEDTAQQQGGAPSHPGHDQPDSGGCLTAHTAGSSPRQSP